jgi:hypothetical protein
MSRSFVSSLLGLSLLAAGCGERATHYTPGEVRAAFQAEGLLAGDVTSFPGLDEPAPVNSQPARPVPLLLGKLRIAFGVPTLRRPTPVTIIRGTGASAYVYALDHDAHRQEFELEDRLAAERTLGISPGFAVIRHGNVVVSYRILSNRLPSFLQGSLPYSPREYYASIERRVAAALDRLD